MTSIKHLFLAFTLTLVSALVCVAQEQSKESANASTTENAVGPISGEGTSGKIAKFTGTNAIGNSVITESGTKIAVNFNSPTAHLQVHAPVLAIGPGNGINATTLLQTSGGKGGNTTGLSAGTQTGGTGASILLAAGAGGDAPVGSTRGNGGNITLQPGAMGSALNGSEGTAGTNGKVLIAPNGIGNVEIGVVNTPNFAKVQVVALSGQDGVYATSVNGNGLNGESGGTGVRGHSTAGGDGVFGSSVSGYAGYFDGNVQVTGNICAANFTCTSDARLKQNVTALNYGLNQVLRLRPVSWHWKTEPEGKLQLGLVAQEVESVMPELVLREANPAKPLGLNYMSLLPVVVKAIQEQQREIEGKEAEIKALRAENEAIKARLDALERTITKSADNVKP